MPTRDRRRVVVWIVVAAAAIAFALGWWARASRSTPESRAREAAEQIKERVREWTH